MTRGNIFKELISLEDVANKKSMKLLWMLSWSSESLIWGDEDTSAPNAWLQRMHIIAAYFVERDGFYFTQLLSVSNWILNFSMQSTINYILLFTLRYKYIYRYIYRSEKIGTLKIHTTYSPNCVGYTQAQWI